MIESILRDLKDIAARLGRLESRSRPLRFVPLTTPLTSTSWDGDAYSVAAATLIDLSAVFGVPAGVKAVLVRLVCRDSVAWGTGGLFFAVSPADGSYAVYAVTVLPYGGDVSAQTTGVCPCDANGDIYYTINASGAGTMDCWIQIWGYWR